MARAPLDYLFSLEQFGIKFGLGNMRVMLAALGHPERTFAAVHVAGTNGKGSVTALVESVLRSAGIRTGRYTSPHLVSLTERFAIEGAAVAERDMIAAVADVRDAVMSLQSSGRLDVHPTFFEVTTATAFELFRRARVDLAVCEVGLGGRLDATNVLTPVVTAITSIALDHQRYLGGTLAEIAAEKAGIIKRGIPVVVGAVSAEVAEVIDRTAREQNAPVVAAHQGVTVATDTLSVEAPQRLRLATPAHDYGLVELGLSGRHQIANAVVAVRIVEELERAGWLIPPTAVANGIAGVRWRGRLERVRLEAGREALLDAAHNPAGAATLAAFLAELGDRRPLVFAAMQDKDAAGILRILAPHVSAVIVTRASHPRSFDPLELARIVGTVAPDLPHVVAEAPADALATAWTLGDRIVVAGSIFLLGDVMSRLGGS